MVALRQSRAAVPWFLIALATFATSLGQTPTRKTDSWVRNLKTNQAAIIFVHGVMGNEHSTWSSGDQYWPRMLTGDTTFNGQNIYVYSYPSPMLGRSFSIGEVADNLRLVLDTDDVMRHKELTFVSHSMGGLVTREFIVKYQKRVRSKIRLLYFFATPTTGTPSAILANIVSRNPQFKQLYPMQSDNYLGTVQSHWLAADLGLKSYCAYETLPLYGQIIVERPSATNLCTERLDPIDADHITISKPTDQNSTSYRALKAAFQETSPRGQPKAARPTIKAVLATEILSRLYVRGVPPAPSSTSYHGFHLQELFYEWTITITPSAPLVSAVTVVIRDSKPLTDRLRITPDEDVTASESVPKWASGFNETRTADYYVKTVKFSRVPKSGVAVVLRRPIKLPHEVTPFSEADFQRSFQIHAEGCEIKSEDRNPHEEAARLVPRLFKLADWRYSGPDQPPVPIKRDPDMLHPLLPSGEFEASFEARCKDDLCEQVIVSQLTVRRP